MANGSNMPRTASTSESAVKEAGWGSQADGVNLIVPAERMPAMFAGPAPVLKADARLDGRPGLADEHLAVGADQIEEAQNGRNARLAHSDDADLGRLEHGDADIRAVQGMSQPHR